MKDLGLSYIQTRGQVAIIGGSAEARALAALLGAQGRIWRPASDRVTGALASDRATLKDFVRGASALIIAPHPCDVHTFRLGVELATSSGLPSVAVIRPAWRPHRRDVWFPIKSVSQAVAQIPAGSRVLVTLGRPALADLCALRHAVALVRQLSDHRSSFPLRHGRFLHGIAPFTVVSEIALMRRYRIDAVLTRNAGGAGGWPKVAAARALGIPIYMVERPKVFGVSRVPTVEDAMEWVRTRLWSDA